MQLALTMLIFWEPAKNYKDSLKDWEKQLLDMVGKTAPTKAKSSPTASRASMDEEKSAGRSGPVQNKGSTQTKD